MSGKREKEIRHMHRFMGGRMTPQEAHIKWGIRRQCMEHPDRPAVIRIKVFMAVKDMAHDIAAMVRLASPEAVPVVQFKGSGGLPVDYVKVSDKGFCHVCAPTAERAAAHGPSWAVVEIDRGPNPTGKVSIAVPS